MHGITPGYAYEGVCFVVAGLAFAYVLICCAAKPTPKPKRRCVLCGNRLDDPDWDFPNMCYNCADLQPKRGYEP